MGNAIARSGDSIVAKSISGHISTKYWYDYGNDSEGNYLGGDYVGSSTSATVSGSIQRTSGTVYANGKLVCVKGNNTNESDSYSLPSGHIYVSGSHSGVTNGRITGSSSSVYISGVLVARKGDSVTNHAGTGTTINSGSTNVFVG